MPPFLYLTRVFSKIFLLYTFVHEKSPAILAEPLEVIGNENAVIAGEFAARRGRGIWQNPSVQRRPIGHHAHANAARQFRARPPIQSVQRRNFRRCLRSRNVEPVGCVGCVARSGIVERSRIESVQSAMSALVAVVCTFATDQFGFAQRSARAGNRCRR